MRDSFLLKMAMAMEPLLISCFKTALAMILLVLLVSCKQSLGMQKVSIMALVRVSFTSSKELSAAGDQTFFLGLFFRALQKGTRVLAMPSGKQ